MAKYVNISSDIVMDANHLRHTNLQKKALSEYIVEILRNIKEELRIAHQEGSHEITYSLPITFNVPNMSNKECQRIIWATIFSRLISKNYRVSWYQNEKNNDKIFMKITWISIEDENTVKQQLDLIRQLQVAPP
jgi:hypothetical protein